MKALPRTIISNSRLISRSLLLATLSTVGLMMGSIPRSSNPLLSQILGTVAHAQESFIDQGITDEEITKYAASVLKIEDLRIGVYREIQNEFQKQSPNMTVPPIICSDKNSVNNPQLSQNIQVIAIDYCNQAKKIIETNDLTVSRFNRITMTQKTDPRLQQKIQDELIRLQQPVPQPAEPGNQ
ncbi:MAG: DUF4168 domain-containing protein [Trichodesmium sp.]